MHNSPIHAIGKTARRVVERLQDLGYATRPVSSSTIPPFDWDQPSTWSAALAGTRAVYVAYQLDLAVPRVEPAIREPIDLAKEAGIQRMALFSGHGEVAAQPAEGALGRTTTDFKAYVQKTVATGVWTA
jgi:hypothetical protein